MNNRKQKRELQRLIAEIEKQSIAFDSSNWYRYQSICVDWGDKVAPFIKPNKDSHKRFISELGILRAVIHDPILPSDLSGAPLQNALNNMIGEAKQRLQELEYKIKPEGAFAVVSKVWHDSFWGKVLVAVVAGIILISIGILIQRFIFSATSFQTTTQPAMHHQEQVQKQPNRDASHIPKNKK